MVLVIHRCRADKDSKSWEVCDCRSYHSRNGQPQTQDEKMNVSKDLERNTWHVYGHGPRLRS